MYVFVNPMIDSSRYLRTDISLAAHTDAPYTHEYGAGISDGMPPLHLSPHFTN